LSFKRTLLFLVILIAVGSIYFFKAYKPSLSEKPLALTSDPAPVRMLELKQDEFINRLSITNAVRQNKLVFEKREDRSWQIVDPVTYPAESMLIRGMTSLLKMMPKARLLSLDPNQTNDFEFETPRMVICISTNQVSEERCLRIGADAVIGQGAYAKWDDESKYFLVGKQFLDSYNKSLYSLRKKQVFTLVNANLEFLRFRSQDEDLELKQENENWVLTKPLQAALGRDVIHKLLTDLNSFYVKEFLDDESPENPELGLLPVRRVIRATFKDGTNQTVILGAPALGKNAYYVRTADANAVALISKGKLEAIESAFKALIS